MTVNAQTALEGKFVEATQTTQYTSPTGQKMIIDKCTAFNTDTVTQTITVNKVGSGGTAGPANIVEVKALQANESYTFPAVVGKILMPGGFISALATVAGKINLSIDGRMIT